ncbi:MAG: 3'-5' exonuclease [Candidatus Saganbacteria bacterium]|nr:3'-5' exonuclease [Candidatus Saganbacteria bacterium]
MSDLLKDKEFIELEKKFPFLSRYRQENEIDKLPYIIVDIETTGLDPASSEIIEIGAIKTAGPVEKDVFTTLIKPTGPIPPEIERLTGISQDMVEGKPGIKQVLQDFIDFAGSSIIVAHNSDFDLGFLKYHIRKELEKEFTNRVACTVKVSRTIVPGLRNYKLHTVAEHMGIEVRNRHRAMGDSEITFKVWNKLVELMMQKDMTTFHEIEKIMAV